MATALTNLYLKKKKKLVSLATFHQCNDVIHVKIHGQRDYLEDIGEKLYDLIDEEYIIQHIKQFDPEAIIEEKRTPTSEDGTFLVIQTRGPREIIRDDIVELLIRIPIIFLRYREAKNKIFRLFRRML